MQTSPSSLPRFGPPHLVEEVSGAIGLPGWQRHLLHGRRLHGRQRFQLRVASREFLQERRRVQLVGSPSPPPTPLRLRPHNDGFPTHVLLVCEHRRDAILAQMLREPLDEDVVVGQGALHQVIGLAAEQ